MKENYKFYENYLFDKQDIFYNKRRKVISFMKNCYLAIRAFFRIKKKNYKFYEKLLFDDFDN